MNETVNFKPQPVPNSSSQLGKESTTLYTNLNSVFSVPTMDAHLAFISGDEKAYTITKELIERCSKSLGCA